MKRPSHLESLETRNLCVADLVSPVVDADSSGMGEVPAEIRRFVTNEEYASMMRDWEKTQFIGSMASAFSWQDARRPVQIGDAYVTVEDNTLRVFTRTESSGEFDQRSVLELPDYIASVTTVGSDHLMIVTQRVNPLQTKFVSTVILADLDASNQIVEIDRVVRNLQFDRVLPTSDGFQIAWHVTDISAAAARAEFQSASIALTDSVNSDSAERYLFDFVSADETTLPREPMMASEGYLSVLAADADTLVVRADHGVYLVDTAAQSSRRVDVSGFTRVTSASVTGSEVILRGESSGAGYVSARLVGERLLPVGTALTGNAAKLQLEAETTGAIFNDSRVPGVTVYPGMNGVFRIVSKIDEQLVEQTVTLPGYRVGFRPAFVIDADTILAVRAHIDTELIRANAIPDLTLHLLSRQATGEFKEVEVLPLEDFDFRAISSIQAGGVLTLQNQQNARVIRVVEDSVQIQSIDLPATQPYPHSFSQKLTAFADVAFFTSQDQTVLVDQTSSEVNTIDVQALDQVIAAVDLDTNQDGLVTALDALLIINRLNADAPADELDFDAMYDINKDGVVTPVDVLLVINELNASDQVSAEGESQGLQESGQSTMLSVGPAPEPDLDDSGKRRRRFG